MDMDIGIDVEIIGRSMDGYTIVALIVHRHCMISWMGPAGGAITTCWWRFLSALT